MGFCNQKIKSSPECPQNQWSSQLHFFWLPGLVLQKMGRQNEDSCTRRANDLEANYKHKFFPPFFLVCSWSWRFWLMQPCLSCMYVICTKCFRDFPGMGFCVCLCRFQVRLTKLELLKSVDLRSSQANMYEGTQNAESHASWIRYRHRCFCRREFCILPAVSNPSLFNYEAEKAYVCMIMILFYICIYIYMYVYFRKILHIHTRTFIVDYNMHTLDKKHSGLKL